MVIKNKDNFKSFIFHTRDALHELLPLNTIVTVKRLQLCLCLSFIKHIIACHSTT